MNSGDENTHVNLDNLSSAQMDAIRGYVYAYIDSYAAPGSYSQHTLNSLASRNVLKKVEDKDRARYTVSHRPSYILTDAMQDTKLYSSIYQESWERYNEKVTRLDAIEAFQTEVEREVFSGLEQLPFSDKLPFSVVAKCGSYLSFRLFFDKNKSYPDKSYVEVNAVYTDEFKYDVRVEICRMGTLYSYDEVQQLSFQVEAAKAVYEYFVDNSRRLGNYAFQFASFHKM